MAYFHVFSLSLFIFSFLSVSSSSCVNGQWNGFFRTASRLLHSIFETLMCLWHIFCLSHVKTFFLLLCYRNSGAGVERQSAARKAKSDCLAASIPGWTISTRLASITQPDRFVSPASVFDVASSSDKSRSTSSKSIERWILFKISNHKYHTIHREGVDLVTEDVARGLSDESIGVGSEFPRVYSTFSIVLINKRWWVRKAERCVSRMPKAACHRRYRPPSPSRGPTWASTSLNTPIPIQRRLKNRYVALFL